MRRATTSWLPRFPWVQLVFCLACLSMAAWTWMRYSYCWEVTPQALAAETYLGMNDMYVSLAGEIEEKEVPFECRSFVPPDTWLDGYPPVVAFLTFSGHGRPLTVKVQKDATDRYPRIPGRGEQALLSGRVLPQEWWSDRPATVNLSASRFSGAGIAGLVVGAMGCFIFGLYLRCWLRGREALASEPGRDMIA